MMYWYYYFFRMWRFGKQHIEKSGISIYLSSTYGLWIYSVPIPPGGPMGIYFVDFDVEFHPSCRQDSPLCHELNIFHWRQPVQEFCVRYYVFVLVLQNELDKKFK